MRSVTPSADSSADVFLLPSSQVVCAMRMVMNGPWLFPFLCISSAPMGHARFLVRTHALLFSIPVHDGSGVISPMLPGLVVPLLRRTLPGAHTHLSPSWNLCMVSRASFCPSVKASSMGSRWAEGLWESQGAAAWRSAKNWLYAQKASRMLQQVANPS